MDELLARGETHYPCVPDEVVGALLLRIFATLSTAVTEAMPLKVVQDPVSQLSEANLVSIV